MARWWKKLKPKKVPKKKKKGTSIGDLVRYYIAYRLARKKGVGGLAIIPALLKEREGPPAVSDWAKKMGVPEEEAVRRWRKAENIAMTKFKMPPLTKTGKFQKTPTGKFWKYAMAIFKTMMYQRPGQSSAKGARAIRKRAAEKPPSEPKPRVRRRKVKTRVAKEAVGTKEVSAMSVLDEVRRMSRSAVKARSKAAKKPMTPERRKKAKLAKKYRKKHKAKLAQKRKRYRPRPGSESVEISYVDAIALMAEGLSAEAVVLAIQSGEVAPLIESAVGIGSDDAEHDELIDTVLSALNDPDITEEEISEFIDVLDEDEVEVLQELIDSAEEDDEDEDEVDEAGDFEAFFAKIKKGNKNITRGGAEKMFAAMNRMRKKKKESVEDDDEDGDALAEKARWKKELEKKYGKMPAGLAKHKIGKVKAAAAGAGARKTGVGAQVARSVAARGEYAKKAKIGGKRTMKAFLKRRQAEIMDRPTKGTRGSKETLKKKLRGIKTHRTRVAAGGKAHKTKVRREKGRKSLKKARQAKLMKAIIKAPVV